ncbi:hypothetical protein RAB80_003411 [Fusarium oxysporum f. sp. vasinfectum]|nr:hypothetical protein RAB80_003411 [Fusarium oxysporum f. sp. vasinfectum]
MLPRKKARPNPAISAANNDSQTLVSNSTTEAPTSQSQASKASPAVEADHNNNAKAPSTQQIMGDPGSTAQHKSKDVRKTKSWYGSWQRPSKASASTSVAKENIFGGSVKSNKTSDLSRYEARKGDDNASIRSTAGTIKTMPKVSETKSDVTMTEESAQAESQTQKKSDPEPSRESSKVMETRELLKDAVIAEPTPPKAPESKTNDNQGQPDTCTEAPVSQTDPQRPAASSGWLGWWSKTPFTETQAAPAPDLNGTATAEAEATKEVDEPRPVTPPAQTTSTDQVASPKSIKAPQPTSWFSYWYPAAESVKASEDKQDTQPQPSTDAPSEDVTMTEAPPPHEHEPPPKAGSTWVFWSKESPKSKDSTPMPESGEVAIMGEGSEAHPRPMAECDVSPTKDRAKADVKPKEAQATVKSGWMKKNKRGRPQSMDLDPPSPSVSGTSTPTSTTPATQDIDKAAVKAASSSPSFFAHNKLHRTMFSEWTTPPKIRKAIAIGVHGLFPATYLRPMIGQPTGTSLRFAALGAEAIRRWTESHGCDDCEIEKVALEGEGKIRDRVDNLWNLMLNWIDHIRSADFILIACHSQGVPVSIMLLEKLIDLGIITNAKVGVCAMAGVALGPFPDYKSGLLMGSAAELWEFGNPESDNSKRFEKALKRVVDYGTRITFIGSIDDQVVPMESAIYSPANHPYIYRAVFIDGRVHAPDFIAHLVGFALKLRNLGVSDHGLIRELSVPLAGSLYSGAGHSRLYYDDAVYDLAIAHALETAPAGSSPPPCTISPRGGPLTSQNPYVLPWIMRGLLEENFVRTELSNEADELLRQFDDWKPTNKALKDVKYRLEAVRSKL